MKNKMLIFYMDLNYKLVFALLIVVVMLFLTFRKPRRKTKSVRWAKPLCVEHNHIADKTIVYSSYNKSYTNKPFIKLSKELTERFCKFHNHVYKQIVHEDDFMSPYWLRVYDLYNMCIDNIDNTIIMYLDADAVVLHEDVSVNTFIKSVDPQQKSDIYISEDPNIDHIYYAGIFNTGCFIVRNTTRSRKFIKEWLGKYNIGNKWEKKDKEWKCTIKGTECSWSHDGYEQGEFSNLSKKYNDTIMRLHWSALACKDVKNKNCYVLHLMGFTDSLRESTFKKLL